MWILYILLGLVALGLIGALVSALCRAFPWLILVVPLVLGIVSFVLWHVWWVSLIIFFVCVGILSSLSETKTRRGNTVKCGNCGCTRVEIVTETDDVLVYKCPNCGEKGSYRLVR